MLVIKINHVNTLNIIPDTENNHFDMPGFEIYCGLLVISCVLLLLLGKDAQKRPDLKIFILC